MKFNEITVANEAANPAQQAAIAIAKKKEAVNEFAPNRGNGGGGNYLLALASAWYYQDPDMLLDVLKQGGRPMQRIIDAQQAVERILQRGIHCGDGKVRKYNIGYNAGFNGVEIQSDDHYEYTDYDDAGNEIDSRTGQPWGPYDLVKFSEEQMEDDDDLDEDYDSGEYNDEAGMAQGNLHTIAKAAQGLLDTIDDRDNLPEWVQEKIAKVEGMLVSVWNYLQSQKAQGIDPQVSESICSLDEAHAIFDDFEQSVSARGLSEDIFDSVTDEEIIAETAAWRRKEGKNKNGGLNKKGVASYRREHPGSKLQTAVTTKPSKLKKGSKAAKRRKSFCARMSGVKGPMKKPNGKPTRKALALRKWNC